MHVRYHTNSTCLELTSAKKSGGQHEGLPHIFKEAGHTRGNSVLLSRHMEKKLVWDPIHLSEPDDVILGHVQDLKHRSYEKFGQVLESSCLTFLLGDRGLILDLGFLPYQVSSIFFWVPLWSPEPPLSAEAPSPPRRSSARLTSSERPSRDSFP